MPEDVRNAYLVAASVAVDLIADHAVRAAWDEPSALPEMSTGALAAHLARAVLQLEAYLDGDEPEGGERIDGVQYFAQFTGLDDRSAPLNVGVRQRAVEGAAGGADAVARDARAALDRLTARLPGERADRLVAVFAGLVLPIDEYVRTRVIELVVHLDDLSVSVGRAAPALPEPAASIAIDTLVGIARRRHGDVAVLRALTRRERDDVSALRVF